MATNYDVTDLLDVLKSSLGYSTKVRDRILESVIHGVIDELEQNIGITIDLSNNEIFMFIVDYSADRYLKKGAGAMDRNIRYRLNNLIVKYRPAKGGTTP